MKIFTPLYNKMMQWAKHPAAIYYLGAVSFAESSFFPIPPDFLLAPMSLAAPKRAWWYATITTLTSVLGGLFGYFIGLFALTLIQPLLQKWGYMLLYHEARLWFHQWGFWVLLVVAFSPIPYKVFTIAAGSLAMPLLPFILASMIGRGARFFLVSGLIYWRGEAVEQWLRRYIDWIGWLSVMALLAGYFVWRH